MSATYRVRQFVRAVGAWFRPVPVDEDLLRRYLPPQAVELFGKMPRYDRQHALAVFGALQQTGYADPDLLAAALLHDVGKTTSTLGRMALWHRLAVVLLRAAWPGALDRIAEDRPGSWRRPFFVQQHHATIGAELARKAGCSPATVNWISRHKECAQPEDRLLAALQSADNMN
jgi:putative nucleotidyltransferase with HDIG domain